MKPYPLRNLTHEKRTSRFRIFLSPLHLAPEKVEKASCVLHNILCEEAPARHTPTGSFDRKDEHTGRVIEGNGRSDMNENNGMIAAELGGNNNYTSQCKNIRDNFCLYFNTSGKVPWHDKFV